MEFVKRNKGVIIFYLLLVFATVAIIQSNDRAVDANNGYVYLVR